MSRSVLETLIGVVLVVVVAVPAVFLALRVSESDAADTYVLSAHFNKVGGLQEGNDVKVAGIRIGRVIRQYLDLENLQAVVEFTIDSRYHLPVDTEVTIASAGLFAGNFLKLDPGSSDDRLEPGGVLENVKDVASLEDEIAAVAFGTGSF
jgi:phospholipid/cholesterol/gamma-HCH transport system substrate-binding protein